MSNDITTEYAMRHAANGLMKLADRLVLTGDDLSAINYAYQVLLRGSDSITAAKEEAWQEGWAADVEGVTRLDNPYRSQPREREVRFSPNVPDAAVAMKAAQKLAGQQARWGQR